RLDVDGGRLVVRIGDQSAPAGDRPQTKRGVPLVGGVRPEHVEIVADDGLHATVAHVELLGHETLVHADVGDVRLIARADGMLAPAPGARGRLRFDPARLYLSDAYSRRRHSIRRPGT